MLWNKCIIICTANCLLLSQQFTTYRASTVHTSTICKFFFPTPPPSPLSPPSSCAVVGIPCTCTLQYVGLKIKKYRVCVYRAAFIISQDDTMACGMWHAYRTYKEIRRSLLDRHGGYLVASNADEEEKKSLIKGKVV